VALGVALVLCAPMLIARSSSAHRAFFNDWVNHLYLVARQAAFVQANQLSPTYFLNTEQLGWATERVRTVARHAGHRPRVAESCILARRPDLDAPGPGSM